MEIMLWVIFIAMPFCYAYLVIFSVRDTIIDKLIRLYIYTDPTFANKSKYTRGDWDSLNHSKFITKAPILFALLKEGSIILGLPAFVSLISVFIFGNYPVHSIVESDQNVKILIITIGYYYLFALLVCIYHRISFKRYKEMASMEKNLWEAKSIIAKK